MGDVWTWPAYVGIVGGTVVFAVIFLPALVLEFRRFGRPAPSRIVALAAAAIYGVALIAYTLLPLPTGDLTAWCGEHASPHNFRPGAFVNPLSREIRDAGALAALRGPVGLQVVFNVLLFVPFGVLVRLWCRRTVGLAVVAGLLTSVLVEATQFTGIFGSIPCSYRVGDVDDVVTNTTGALIGALVAPVLMRLIPTTATLTRGRTQARPVTTGRRWVGMAVDATLVVLVPVVTVATVNALRRFSGSGSLPPHWEVALSAVAAVGGVLIAPSLIGSGASWGQRAVWLEPQWEAGRASAGARQLRALATMGPWTLSYLVASATGVHSDRLGALALLLWSVIGLGALLVVPWTRSRRGLSGVLTGSEMVDTRRTTPTDPSIPSAERAQGASR